ncbi:MAG: hypothetical protein AB9903_28965 [Vulcanimicrobiota bacterium]
MKKLFMVLLVFIFLSLCTMATYSQDLTNVKIVPSPKDAAGRILVLSITGNTYERVAYLGCSFYPSKYTSKMKEGSHEIVQVSNSFTKTWEIPEKFNQGSFEIALWRNKVMKSRCGSNDCFLCRRFGYHLDTMLDFCSGTLLATKPLTLRISIAENAGFVSVTVNGAAQNGNAYLGVSFYPNGCRDSLTEGRFDCRHVQSTFSEIWTIPEKFKGGRYDIALWNNKINKNECTLKSCVWCKKLGYHLWWLLFLKSGVIEAHQQ